MRDKYSRQNIHFYLLPAGLFLLNLLTKSAYLTTREIALDEPFSIYHAQFSIPVIVQHLQAYNNPPLFEIILHFWIKLFGIEPLAVRILPLLFACVAPVALYFFALKNFSLRIAVVSSLLLSLSSLLLWYSHDCRVYSLFVLLSVLSMHFYLANLSRSFHFPSAFWFVLNATLLIYAHYFGLFVLFVQTIHLLVFARRKIKLFLLLYVAIFILYLPHLWPFFERMGDSVSRGTWVEPPAGLESLYNALWSFSNFPFITVGGLLLMFAALVKLLLRRGFRVSSPVASLVVGWFLFVWIGMYVISFWVPMYIPRYLIYGLPAYYVTLALCIDYLLKHNRLKIVVASALVLCFGFTLELNPDKKQPVNEAMAIIRAHKDSATTVIAAPYELIQIMSYHYDRSIFSRVEDHREYHLVDSLLRERNIYHLHSFYDFTGMKSQIRDKVLYFAGSQKHVSPENETFRWLSDSMQLRWLKKVGPNWTITAFER